MSVIESSSELGIYNDPVKIKAVTEPVEHAEGPHWSEEEQVLYFVDIAGHGVHKYNPLNYQHTSVLLNDTVGVVVPIEGFQHEFVIGYGKDLAILTWNGEGVSHKIKTLYTVDKDKSGNRFNDGKADLVGNLWIGTMGEEKPVGKVKMNQGSLFKIDTDCNLTKEVSPVSISNGITWNRENNIMYYIDSPTRKIDAFDFNEITSKIKNRRVFFDFEKNRVNGVPDGMTIDTDNNLWVACWGGSKVIQVCGKNGKLLRSISLPVVRVTSLAFGGIDLTTLFVTTMKTGLSQEEILQQPLAGSVFSIEGLGVTGTTSNNVRLHCLI